MTLIKDLRDIIYEMKYSMCVGDVIKDIEKLNRRCFKADDIWIEDHNHYWNDNHQVYVITTDRTDFKSIHLDYRSKRDLGNIHWIYVCGKCGEYLKLIYNEHQFYECKCHMYLMSV